MPVRGLGQKKVDFCGSRSPRSASARMRAGVVGGQEPRGDRFARSDRRVGERRVRDEAEPRAGQPVQRSFVEGANGRGPSRELDHPVARGSRFEGDRGDPELVVGQRRQRRIQVRDRIPGSGGGPVGLEPMERKDGKPLRVGVHHEDRQPVPRPGSLGGASFLAVAQARSCSGGDRRR